MEEEYLVLVGDHMAAVAVAVVVVVVGVVLVVVVVVVEEVALQVEDLEGVHPGMQCIAILLLVHLRDDG